MVPAHLVFILRPGFGPLKAGCDIGEGKSLDPSMSYSFYNSLPVFTQFIPKDRLAFVYLVLVYLFGLGYFGLALCWCFTLINEHDEIIYDTLFSLLIMMMIL
jgi:apolipoprotein N-acyltransferase